MSDEYRLANDMEFAECNCDENYDLLVGPNGWECLLTEPEDRRWQRDLEPVVDELNRLRAEVERLRMTQRDHEAVAWAIAVTVTIYDDPIGPIRRETLRDLARRHERHAAPIV
jgi:hypothetical protein